MIFAFGARRSGTYWLDRVISAHPGVTAVPSETHLFFGIAQLMERFHHGGRDSPKTALVYVDRELLIDSVRDLCDRVLGQFLPPGGARLLERTALHADHAGLIGEVYPDAHLVHIVRDPRDVVRSLIAQPWGPASVEEAAAEWRASVLGGLAARTHARYLEIRYERLRAEPRAEVERLYAALGLPRSPGAIEAAIEAARVPVNVAPAAPEPGVPRKRPLTRRELRELDAIAGDLMAELGYGRPAEAGSAPTGHALRAVTRRLAALRRLRPASPAPAPRPSNPDSVLWLMDRLLSHAVDGHARQVADLLAPDVSVRIGEGATSVVLEGEAGRDRLIEALTEDPVLRWRQLASDLLPGNPTAAYVLTYEDESGARAERVLVATADGERLARVALFKPRPG